MGFSRQEYWSGLPLPSLPVQASSLAVLGPVLTAFSCRLPVSAAIIKIKLPGPEAQSVARLRAVYWSQLGNVCLTLSLWFLL